MDRRTASFLRHARELTELGRYDEAAGLERQAREAAARAGDPPDALLAWHVQAGRRAFLQSDWAAAERALREASALAMPGGATPRERFDVELRLGLALQRLERADEAVAQLERTLALDLGPAFEPPPAAYRALAESLREAGRDAEADAALAAAERAAPPADRGAPRAERACRIRRWWRAAQRGAAGRPNPRGRPRRPRARRCRRRCAPRARTASTPSSAISTRSSASPPPRRSSAAWPSCCASTSCAAGTV